MTYLGDTVKDNCFLLNQEISEQFSRDVVEKLTAIRKAKGWSQEQLAESAGVSRTGITMMEGGERRPTVFFCHAVANALDSKLSDIIKSVEDKS